MSDSNNGSDNSNNNKNNNQTSKTLSKRLMYLPLVAYELAISSGPGSDPATYLDNRKSLPASVQEKALVNFWHKVGVSYHRNQATVHDPKNNGNRPIPLRDLEDKIRQRALTLLGGGINSAWATTTSTSTSTSGNNNKNRIGQTMASQLEEETVTTVNRKKRKRDQAVMTFGSLDLDGSISLFLQELNGLWNDHIYQLLQLPTAANISSADKIAALTTCSDTKFWARVTACVANEETSQLVGAQVRIKACKHCPRWMGRRGVLVGRTTNTWNVMVPVGVGDATSSRRKGKKKQRNKNANILATEKEDTSIDQTTNIQQGGGWKSMVVPKRGSSLSLLIPLEGEIAGTSNDDSLRSQLLFDSTDIDNAITQQPLLVINLEDSIPLDS